MGSQQSVPEGEEGDVRSRSASPLVQENDNHWGKYEKNESFHAISDVPHGQQFDDDEQPQSPASGERKKKKKKKSKHRRSPSPAAVEPELNGSAKFKKKSPKSKRVTVDISDDPISDGEDNVHRDEAPSSEHHVKRPRLSPEHVAQEDDEYDHGELDASFVKREPGADEHEPSMVAGHQHTSPLVARERRRARSASQHPVEVASSAPLVPQFATQQSLSFHDETFDSTLIPASVHPMDLHVHIDGLPNTQDFADGLPPSSQEQFDGFPHSSQRPRTDGLPAVNSSMWEDNMRHGAMDEPEDDDHGDEGYMHHADEVEPDKADVETASSAGDPEPDNHSDHEMDIDQDSAPEISVTQTPAPKARKSRTKKAQAQPEEAEAATPAPTSTAKTPRSKGSKRKVKVPYFERDEVEARDNAETSAEPSVKKVAAREKKRKARAEDEQSTANVEPAPKKAKVSAKKKPVKKAADSDQDNSEVEEAGDRSNMAKPTGRMTQAEHARIKSVIDSFREANGLTKHAVNDMIHQDPRKEAKNRELWGFIVDACPNRPRRKLVNYCRQNFHNFPARGSWTKEQDEELESMLKIHGQKWTLIGGLINRFPDDVRDRYRNYLACGGKNRKDYWSEEEEERFLKVVAEAIDRIKSSMAKKKKKSDDESPESLINWQQISTAMNHTRTRLQCLQKWKTLRKNEALPDSIMVKLPDGESSRLDKARKDLRKITPQDKALLARAIRDSGVDRENKIKWKEIQKEVFDKQYAKTALTVTWGRLRQAVPQWESKSTQECAKYLCDMYERDADWKGDEEVGGDDDAEDNDADADADVRSTVSKPASVVVSSTQQTKIYRTPRVGLWDPPKETKTKTSHVFAESSDNEMRGRTSQRARERAKRLKESEKASSKSKKSQLSEALVQDEDDSDEEEVQESINGDIAAVNGNDFQDFEMEDSPNVDEEDEPLPSAPVVRSRAASVDLGEPTFISSPQLPTSAQKRQDYSDDEEDDEDIMATTSKAAAAALKASKKAPVRTYGKGAKPTKSKRKEKDLDLDVPLVLGAAVPSLPPPSTSLSTASHPQLSPKRPAAASQARHPSVINDESDHFDDAAPANSQLHNKKRRILTRQPSVRTTETIIKTTASVAKAGKRRKGQVPADDSSELAVASAVPDHLVVHPELVEMDGNLADDSLVSLDRPGDVVGGVGREKKVARKAKEVRKKLASAAVSVAGTPGPLIKTRVPRVAVDEVQQDKDTRSYSVISSDMDDMDDIPAVLPVVGDGGTQG
ncbi:hypothetical protein QBC32DRAFT_370999 [Pseudoneurospora amorphoporcata]|uniref:Uncharacterized protein n=1 Tax=Pseudoneurospora amorphoporcata TaxID=241081 RepID=A0AAN6SET9_9PEZI|nr:hypothetical protein QBC32DRAFT_370999 [Pseudoneurospora amorphoporcata]